MVVTPEKDRGDLKLFEFWANCSGSIAGHGVAVFEREQDNCLLKEATVLDERYVTLPYETVQALRSLLEAERTSIGSGKTEQLISSAMFVLDGYGDDFYFCDGLRAIRAYLRMGELYRKLPAERAPRAAAVLALFRKCAALLNEAGIDRRYFYLPA